ncbi:tetratricopeptide repeat protein [Fimbriimonas ginsengisoli]|uniref:tetratricopeptide repeat protein n=1 Tax=Fimbriimonas ginsengisoli TaxID=1005039 RepID=UPI00130DC6C8|nr:tetratricopeptide repeat protein [Fimbriimonas ginsengisoli]
MAADLIDRCGFPRENVVVLDRGQATATRIRQELERLEDPRRVQANDRVFIALALHGEVDSGSGFFLGATPTKNATHRTNPDDYVPMAAVRDIVLKGIPAKHVMLVSDACYAGSIVDEGVGVPSPNASVKDQAQLPFRAIWAGTDAVSAAITNDSLKSTRFLGRLSSELEFLTKYKQGWVTAKDLFGRARSEIALPWTPVARGSFLFAVPKSALYDEQETLADTVNDARLQSSLEICNEKLLRIKALQVLLALVDEKKAPLDHARILGELGSAYFDTAKGSDANAALAIGIYRSVIPFMRSHGQAELAARALANLGSMYSMLGGPGDPARAIDCMKEAQRYYTRESHPLEWARTQATFAKAVAQSQSSSSEAARIAAPMLTQAIELARNKVSSNELAIMLNELGILLVNVDDTQAASCFESALAIVSERNDAEFWAKLQNSLGRALKGIKALPHHRAALTVFTEDSFPEAWAYTQFFLAEALFDSPTGDSESNSEEAIRGLRKALPHIHRETDQITWTSCRVLLADCLIRRPMFDLKAANESMTEADHLLSEVESGMDKDREPEPWAHAHVVTSRLLMLQGKKVEAVAAAQQALAALSEEKNPIPWMMTQLQLGEVLAKSASPRSQQTMAPAVIAMRAAQSVANRLGNKDVIAYASLLLASIQASYPEGYEAARQDCLKALSYYTRESHPRNWVAAKSMEGFIWFWSGENTAHQRESDEKAIQCHLEALAAVEENSESAALIHFNLGQVYLDLSDFKNAREHYTLARDIAKRLGYNPTIVERAESELRRIKST